MTKLTEGMVRQAVKGLPTTTRPAPPPATIANKAHVFTEDQTTMEWYVDGIPVAELKRRYEAHELSINLTLIGANQKQLSFVVYNGDDWRAETYNGREVKRIEFDVYLHQGMMATAAQFSEKHAEAVAHLKNLLAAEVRNG